MTMPTNGGSHNKIPGKLWKTDDGAADLTPEQWGELRLSDFFRDWFLPIVLVSERESGLATQRLYQEAIDWWVCLTGDPVIRLINEFTLSRFRSGLAEARYRRGPLAPERPLAPYSRAKILKLIRAILYRIGPATDPKRPTTKAILAAAPSLVIPQPRRLRPKPPFEVEEARAIAAATPLLGKEWSPRRTCQAPRIDLDRWALAGVSWFYYTGLRSGTILPLEWRMLERRRGDWWINVPAELVMKTGKPITKFVHPAVIEASEPLRASGSEKIFDWSLCYSAFLGLHDRLQKLAWLPDDRRQSPHAWRRTFSRQIGLLGLSTGTRAAQLALDHESAETTREFYCDLEPELIRRLPPLVECQSRLF